MALTGPQVEAAKTYVQSQKLEDVLSDAVNLAIKVKPANAVQFIGNELLKTKKVHVVHFNDVYNMLPMSDDDPIGGVTRFAAVLKKLKAQIAAKGEQLITVFAGDFVAPSLMSTISHGAHMIEVFNELGVDFGCFGNHEFDYGYDSVKRVLAGTYSDDDDETDDNYPKTSAVWLATNMSEPATGAPMGGDAPYVRRTALVDKGGVKVGILSVSEDWLGKCSQLAEGELKYEDFIASAAKAADALRADGADVVFALTHNRLANDRKLTEAVPGIDLLLGGHDHFYKRDRGSRIVKGGQEFRALVHVEVTVSPGGVREDGDLQLFVDRYDIDSEIEEDPQMKAIVERYNAIRDRKYKKTLCTIGVAYPADESFVRFKEGALSAWVCDVCAEDSSKKEGMQSSDISLINGYSFKSDRTYPAGEFTLGNLFAIFPFDMTLMTLSLSGEQLVQMLRKGAKDLPHECGALWHCNHRLKYTIKLRADNSQKYNEIVDVTFDGKPLEMAMQYTVTTVAGPATEGKYGYGFLKSAKRVVDDEYGIGLQDAVVMWAKRHAADKYVPTLGRITIV